MKISQNLPQFINSSALLIVTGTERAEFHLVKGGEATSLQSIYLEEDEDRSDSQGRYEGRAKGGIIVGRSPDLDRSADTNEFLDLFSERIGNVFLENEVKQVYLFTPSHVENEIVKRLPVSEKKKLKKVFSGNYGDKHLFDLLKMIQKSQKEKSVDPKSEDAQKLYNRFPNK